MEFSNLIWCVYMEKNEKLKFDSKYKNEFYSMCLKALEEAIEFYTEREISTENFENKIDEIAFLDMATSCLPKSYINKLKQEHLYMTDKEDILSYAAALYEKNKY